MTTRKPLQRSGSLEVGIHLLAWMFLFGFPHMLITREYEHIPVLRLFHLIGPPVLLAVIFYANYLLLVPRYLLQRKLKKYLTVNTVIIIAAFGLLQGWFWVTNTMRLKEEAEHVKTEQSGKPATSTLPPFERELSKEEPTPFLTTQPQEDTGTRDYGETEIESRPKKGDAVHRNREGFAREKGRHFKEKGRRPKSRGVGATQLRPADKVHNWEHLLFRLRDLVLFVFAAALAAVIRTSQRWHQAELIREQAEAKQIEAELQNLRSQINPHFLLNTLNNIYALIAFDSEKAQSAVQDLSRLLRHLLYENRDMFTDLNKEIDFLRNYVALMRIRLSSNVKVEFTTEVPPDSPLQIAPLIFVSLIENAFKHGVSPTEPSFIRLHITADTGNGTVKCRIENSNFPKSGNDVSGSGVGLNQVQRRLELIYPQRYTWEKGVSKDGSYYYSYLTIKTFPESHED